MQFTGRLRSPDAYNQTMASFRSIPLQKDSKMLLMWRSAI